MKTVAVTRIEKTIEELDAGIRHHEREAEQLKSAVNVLLQMIDRPVRFSKLDGRRLELPKDERRALRRRERDVSMKRERNRAVRSSKWLGQFRTFCGYVRREYGDNVADKLLNDSPSPLNYEQAFKALDKALGGPAPAPTFGKTRSPGARIVFHNRRPRRLP